MLLKGKSEQINLEGLQLKIGDQLIDQVGTDCKEQYFKVFVHVLDDKLAMLRIFVKN